MPELIARAAVEVHLPRLERAPQRLVVHVRERQNLAGRPVLHHAGHEPALVEPHRFAEVRAHLQEFTVGPLALLDPDAVQQALVAAPPAHGP